MFHRQLAAALLVACLSHGSSARAQDLAFYVPVQAATVVPATTLSHPVSITLVGYTDTEAIAYAKILAASSHPVVYAPVSAGSLVATPVTLSLSDSLPVVKVWQVATPVEIVPVVYR